MTSSFTASSFTLESLYDLVAERAQAPACEHSYTQQNLKRGIERLAQKLGEEATETLIAALGCKNNPKPTDAAKQALCEESADLLYHLCLLWYACDTTPEEVCAVLEQRSRNKTTHHP